MQDQLKEGLAKRQKEAVKDGEKKERTVLNRKSHMVKVDCCGFAVGSQ